MASRHASGEAHEFCRRVLPRVSRTFTLNIESLDGRLRDVVRSAYLLCRAADALEDSWPGSSSEVIGRFERFLHALAGDASAADALAADAARQPGARDDLALVAHLPLVLAELASRPADEAAIVRTGLRTMAEGMSRYAARAAARPEGACYLDDDGELADYCWVVAGCVGVMLTGLFERRLDPDHDRARARRHELAPLVGEALQLTNIVLDLPGDVRRGRCYVPASWLAAAGLEPRDLATGRWPEARALVERLETRAHAALDRVADYLDTIPARHVRYRLFCLLPALWARASLRLVRADPRFPAGGRRPKLSRQALWTTAARSLLVARSHRGVRRLLASG